MPRTPITLVRRTLLLGLLAPAVAHASKWNTPEHHGSEEVGPLYNPPPGGISPRDGSTIQDYYRSLAVAQRCAPGLLPGAAGCAAPAPVAGWTLGVRLPGGFPAEPLPPELAARLYPPYGEHYVRAGGTVLLITDDTRIVVGAIPIMIG